MSRRSRIRLSSSTQRKVERLARDRGLVRALAQRHFGFTRRDLWTEQGSGVVCAH